MSTNLSVVQCLVKVCGKIAFINPQLLVSACQDNPFAFTLIEVDDNAARNSTVQHESLVPNFKLGSFSHGTLLLLLGVSILLPFGGIPQAISTIARWGLWTR